MMSWFPNNVACNSPTLFSNFESKTLLFCGFRGAFQDMTGELRAKFMEVSPVRVWAGERNT